MPEYAYKGWQIYDYYQWLLEHVDAYKEPYYNYSLLLHELHSIEYKWGLENDENRATDGVDLRKLYMDENNIPDLFYKEGINCSVLEMLVGLAIRCDNEIMYDGGPSRAGKLFWIMIENLDLDRCSDDQFNSKYVHQQIDRWLSRDFKRNGRGSPFPLNVRNCRDQRKVTIWKQMCGYLSEHFGDYI